MGTPNKVPLILGNPHLGVLGSDFAVGTRGAPVRLRAQASEGGSPRIGAQGARLGRFSRTPIVVNQMEKHRHD